MSQILRFGICMHTKQTKGWANRSTWNTTEVNFLLKLIASYCKKKGALWKSYHDTWKLYGQT